MTRKGMFCAVSAAFLPLMAAIGAEAVPTEAEVRAAEESARAAEAKLDDVNAANAAMKKRAVTLMTTADLISGRRATPPKAGYEEKEVGRFCAEGVTLDNRADGKSKTFSQWLPVAGGKLYRVSALVEVREISGTQNFKFGAMVTRPGKNPAWPDVFVGATPFRARRIEMTFEVPEGGKAMFLAGFEKGQGLATVQDVQVSELTEVVK